MSLFSGILLIGLSYYVARQAFGELPGIIAGILVALQPWLIFWSVVLYGPEILGSFLLTALLVLVSIQASKGALSAGSAALDAVIGLLLLGTEYPVFLSVFLVLPFIAVAFYPSVNRLRVIAISSCLVLLSAPLAYFASRPDFFILTQLSLLYPILVVGLMGALLVALILRGVRPWVKPLVVLFLFLNIGFQALLARADVAKLTIPATQLSTLPAPLAGTLPSYQILTRLEDFFLLQLSFWHFARAALGDLIFVFGLVAVIYGRQLKDRLQYLLILVAGSLFYTIGPLNPDLLSPDWWNFRLALPFIPLVLILVSSLFRQVGQVGPSASMIKRSLTQLRKPLAIGLVILIIVTSVPTYFQVSTSLSIFDHQALWGPVSNWANTTKPNSTFLVFDADLWNWMSSRTSVSLRVYSNSVPSYDPQSYDLGAVISLIRQYRADYAIFDSSTAPTSQLVATYLADPTSAPYGFSLSFTNTASGITVWVYDVSTIDNLTGSISTTTLNLTDNTEAYAQWPNSTYAHWPGSTYADSTVLLVGWGSGLAESRVYLKFASATVPTNARILDERLSVPIGYSYSSAPTNSSLLIGAQLTSANWDSQQLTWLNQPALGESAISETGADSTFHGSISFKFQPADFTASGISVALVPVGPATIWRYSAIYSIEGALHNEQMGYATPLPTMEILYLST